jgi:hypothetical protein
MVFTLFGYFAHMFFRAHNHWLKTAYPGWCGVLVHAVEIVFPAEAARTAFTALLFPLATLFASLRFTTFATLYELAVDILVRLFSSCRFHSLMVLTFVLFAVDLPDLLRYFDPCREQFTGRTKSWKEIMKEIKIQD